VSRRPWTPEDRAELTRRYPNESTSVIARDLGRGVCAVYATASDMGLKKSPEQATQFKPGRRPEEARNYRPVGSVRVTRDGYLERKVTDDTSVYPERRWVAVHRLVWESVNGPVPKGMIVVFRPGMATTDPDLITIDRVELITRAENMARNTIHARSEDLRELSMLKRRLTRAVNKRVRHEEQTPRPE
jgi:hypothetical protein